MEAVTQKTAAHAEEGAAAAKEMESQACKLQQVVSRIQVLVGAGAETRSA
jgi:methyl-accepting chemotaxis protein